MAWTFNPPPGWPVPPPGFRPGPDWQPDPAWGPAPEGWTFWTWQDESGESDPGTAPTAPAAAATHAWQEPVAQPCAWYRNPWLWLLAGIALLALLLGGFVLALRAASPDPEPQASAPATAQPTEDSGDVSAPPTTAAPSAEPSEDPTDAGGGELDGQFDGAFGPQGQGQDAVTPREFGEATVLTNPAGVFRIQVGEPLADATEELMAQGVRAPYDGERFVLVPLTVTYWGDQEVSAWENIRINYALPDSDVALEEVTDIIVPDDLYEAPLLADGQTTGGYMALEVPEDVLRDGRVVISLVGGPESEYVFFPSALPNSL